jgi:crossover junction endodeoxyribonuclease RuvC
VFVLGIDPGLSRCGYGVVERLGRGRSRAVMAIERVLFQANARTAIPVAQAAGVAMVEAMAAGCQVVEYSPNRVKQTITGHGGAGKDQMERMVQTLLGIATPLRPVDAADAVAVALCHLAHVPLRERVGAPAGRATRGNGFRGAEPEAMSSRPGTDDLGFRVAEPIASGARAPGRARKTGSP